MEIFCKITDIRLMSLDTFEYLKWNDYGHDLNDFSV